MERTISILIDDENLPAQIVIDTTKSKRVYWRSTNAWIYDALQEVLNRKPHTLLYFCGRFGSTLLLIDAPKAWL